MLFASPIRVNIFVCGGSITRFCKLKEKAREGPILGRQASKLFGHGLFLVPAQGCAELRCILEFPALHVV